MKHGRWAPYGLFAALSALGCPRTPPGPRPVTAPTAAATDTPPDGVVARVVSADCGPIPAGSVCLPGGLAQVGWHAPDAFFSEGPPRAARLRPIALDAHEVSAAAWRACVTEGRCPAMTCDAADDAPARCIAWQDARAFCAARGGRLPTEAEWERAAAGLLPTHRPYPWGEGTPAADAAAPVDRTPEGLWHLGGGVAEWVEDGGDFYPALPVVPDLDGAVASDAALDDDRDPDAATDASAPDVPPQTDGGLYIYDDPRGPTRSPWRVTRGGDEALALARRTTTLRRFRRPGDRLPWLGFRCAYDVATPSP